MSAKFLHAFTDESPELHKQMGCMTGIFQMFDRQYLLTSRRLGGHGQKRLPPGHALSNSPSVGADRAVCSPQIVLEKNFSKSWNENQRVSVESSRTSFSSSSCSSFSSLDCNRSMQQELPSTDRMIFPERPLKNSPKLKSSDGDNVLGHPDPFIKAVQAGHPSLDIRDVVKDSIYRENHGLSVKTSIKEEARDHRFNYKDSPWPMEQPKSIDELPKNVVQGQSKVSMHMKESLRVLAKLREASWNSSDGGQPLRLSYDARDPFSRPLAKDAPRFSYDGREAASKLREVPRLSLDIKEGLLWTSDCNSRPNSSMRNIDRNSIKPAANAASDVQQEQETSKRPPSVVAKLMGLEELPNLSSPPEGLMGTALNYNQEESNCSDTPSKTPKIIEERKQEPMSRPLNSSVKEPVAQCRRSPDMAMRSASNSKIPVETAPWKQQDRIVLPQKMPKGFKEAHARKQPVSVYGEIEKRLKELEFQQSNKDLRALKQILDSMQAKGLLHSKKREELSNFKSGTCNFDDRDAAADTSERSNRNASTKRMLKPSTTLMTESNAERAFKSPIVIMKPAKSVNSSSDSDSSIIPLEGLSGLPQLRTRNATDKKKASPNNRIVKDQTPKSSPRVPAPPPLSSSDRKSNRSTEENYSKQKSNSSVIAESSFRAQHLPRNNTGSSLKFTNSTSPRLQQKKLDTNRRSRPSTPSPESNKNQRQSAGWNSLDSISPRNKLRRKPAQAQQNDEQQSGVSGRTRSLNHQGDEMSARSDSNISLTSELGTEVTSADKSAEMNISFFQQGSQSPSERTPQKEKPSYNMHEDQSSLEPASTTPGQPSPISVLDLSYDQDDLHPISKTSNASKVDDEKNAGAHNTGPTILSSKFKHKKLANIENLLQKLQQLSLDKDDEAPPVDHIAFLCETPSPDHRYVSEILLASGFLMKDLSSGQTGTTPIQLHLSGYPINPDLFVILEQRKSGWIAKPEDIHQNRSQLKADPIKLRRKLIFDVVNELLIQKLEIGSAAYVPGLSFRAKNTPGKVPSGQQLLKELCSEIEQLKTEKGSCEEDSNVIPDEEVVRKLEGWTNFDREVPGIVLEIERSMFKELVDEVVDGEAVLCLQARAGRRRRQLFARKGDASK